MSKIFDLTGKVALVTGASSGLGLHFARTLSANGAAVAVTARRRDRLESLVNEIQAAGGKAAAIAMDVTAGDSVRAGYAEAEAALGPIDVVVNNAGISIVKPALEMPEATWDEVVNTNLRGAWLVAQTAAQHMTAARRAGRIINIASILGLRTIGQVAPYNAAKAGLLHLTRALAMEWARHGIQVNAISPGYIETEMNDAFWQTPAGQRLIERVPQRRLGKPAHLDGALLLLASDAGTFMTGANIVVDGGHTVNSL
ncbi:SDR family NAD(P)-dependent oxidoreductase [Reyranella sp. CPCC 100927]|uniref:SDR family NAD(P)-dependent oxidoreductase n=1 Tax=Reyranella sp. CPCC 100927 TaxID=2599616 RepID=UPI0011B4405A|nr:glucose 1-dehydrogenase [Reyranella sp. CPCC 100927]TWT10773.1 glucose 1-dehydrogenase [Reyranella sp. CPCC 100927]